VNVVQSNDGRGETMSFKRDEPRTSGFQIAKGPIERTTTIEKTKDGLGFPCCYKHKEYGIRAFGCTDVENYRYIEIVDPLKARDPSVPTIELPGETIMKARLSRGGGTTFRGRGFGGFNGGNRGPQGGGGSNNGPSCYNCGRMGHFLKDCRAPRRNGYRGGGNQGYGNRGGGSMSFSMAPPSNNNNGPQEGNGHPN